MKMIRIFGFLLFMGLFFNACSDDDPAPNSDPDTQADPDSDPDTATELESAWMVSYRVNGPAGSVWYFSVTEDVPQTLEVGSSVELGLNSNVFAVGDNVYDWDGNAQTITKWGIDRTDLSASPEGILSVASVGFNPFIFTQAVLSENQSYLIDLAEGVIIEWNPTDMTITEVIQVEPMDQFQYGELIFTGEIHVVGDNLIIPIRQYPPEICCDIDASNIGALVAVFDTNSKTVQYNVDNRLTSTPNYVRIDRDGTIYAVPIRENGFTNHYYNLPADAPSPHLVLKLNQDGTFDTDYSFDLDAALNNNIEFIESVVAVLDNKLILQYYDSRDVDLDDVPFSERYDSRSVGTRSVVVDLSTGEVNDFEAFGSYDFAAFTPAEDNTGNDVYVLAYSSVEEPFDTSHFLLANSFDSYTELTAYSNIAAGRLVKLWGE